MFSFLLLVTRSTSKHSLSPDNPVFAVFQQQAKRVPGINGAKCLRSAAMRSVTAKPLTFGTWLSSVEARSCCRGTGLAQQGESICCCSSTVALNFAASYRSPSLLSVTLGVCLLPPFLQVTNGLAQPGFNTGRVRKYKMSINP